MLVSDALVALADTASARDVDARLRALDWKALDVERDVPRLRDVLLRLEHRFGVRRAHRFASERVLAATGERVVHHPHHHELGPLTAVSIAPSGRWLVTGNGSWREIAPDEWGTGRIQLWDVAAGRAVQRSEPIHSGVGIREGGHVDLVQWTRDERFVAALQPVEGLSVWSVDRIEAEPGLVLTGIGNSFSHFALSPDGKWVLLPIGGPIRLRPFRRAPLSAEDISLYDDTEVLGDDIDGGAGPAASAGWWVRIYASASLPLIVAAGWYGAVWVVDAVSGEVREQVGTVIGAPARAEARVALDPAGRTLVLAREGRVVALELAGEHPPCDLGVDESAVVDVAWDAAGERVAVVEAERVVVWRPRERRVVAELREGPGARAPRSTYKDHVMDSPSFAFGRRGNAAALVRTDGSVRVYDAEWRTRTDVRAAPRTTGVAFGAEDRVLVTWGQDLVELWDLSGTARGHRAHKLGGLDHAHAAADVARGAYASDEQGAYGYGEGVDIEGPALGPGGEPTRGEQCGWVAWDVDGRAAAAWRPAGSARLACAAAYVARDGTTGVVVAPRRRLRSFARQVSWVLASRHAWPFHWTLGTPHALAFDNWDEAAETIPPATWATALAESRLALGSQR